MTQQSNGQRHFESLPAFHPDSAGQFIAKTRWIEISSVFASFSTPIHTVAHIGLWHNLPSWRRSTAAIGKGEDQ
jgi:hypothetical protein